MQGHYIEGRKEIIYVTHLLYSYMVLEMWIRTTQINLLPPLHGLLLAISSKGSFICTIPHKGQYTRSGVLVERRNFLMGPSWGIVSLNHQTRSKLLTYVAKSYNFSFQPVLHDWCNKGCGMCHSVCGMVHIKEPLLLIVKSSLCGSSGFHVSLSEWSLIS